MFLVGRECLLALIRRKRKQKENDRTHLRHRTFALVRGQRCQSNNCRWLNAVKETKIEFFVRHNSEEKFLTAHAPWRNFSEVICRACAVVVHSWFSHLHGKFCVLALRTFSVSSRGQSFPVSLILHQLSLRGTSSSNHTPSTHQRISSGCQWR